MSKIFWEGSSRIFRAPNNMLFRSPTPSFISQVVDEYSAANYKIFYPLNNFIKSLDGTIAGKA